MDSRRSTSVVDEEGKIKQKHHVLLQEYLVLQKECVSKKRKLKETKERKETLMDEIRFLKRRRNFLLKIQKQNVRRQHNAFQSRRPDAKYDNAGTSGRSFNANEPAMQNSQPTIGSMWTSGSVDKEVGFPPLGLGKKSKDLFTNGKRAEKRKISWQDPVALKV